MSDKHDDLPERYFTVRALAKRWQVSPSQIYNLIHSDAIRYLRFGKAIRIPVNFVKEYEEAACQEQKFTDSGSTRTEQSTSSGTNVSKSRQTDFTRKPDAFQQGQRIAERLSNSALNSSQD